MDLLEYDPNYTYDDNEDMQQEDEMEDWGSDFAEDEQEAMHDDDDTSWKVRRSAIKIIDVLSRHVLSLSKLLSTIILLDLCPGSKRELMMSSVICLILLEICLLHLLRLDQRQWKTNSAINHQFPERRVTTVRSKMRLQRLLKP